MPDVKYSDLNSEVDPSVLIESCDARDACNRESAENPHLTPGKTLSISSEVSFK